MTTETTNETAVSVRREIVRAIELAQHHQQLASEADTDEARSAHRSTMRAYDKAGAEFASGNYPEYVGYGLYYVKSRSTAGTVYRVNIRRASSCNCEAGMSGKDCWHVKAAEICEDIRLADEQAAQAPAAPAHENIALDFSDSDLSPTVTEQEAEEEQAYRESIAGVTDDMIFTAVLDHERAPEPMAEAYAYEREPASDGDDEPARDLYPRNMPRGFRGDIGI